MVGVCRLFKNDLNPYHNRTHILSITCKKLQQDYETEDICKNNVLYNNYLLTVTRQQVENHVSCGHIIN